jgi:iron complex outermembrane receptor protein
LIFGTIGSGAFAAEANSEGRGRADQPGAVIDEVIVTAQKRSERLQDVPLSIVAQSAAQLQAAGVYSTRDLVAVVPGLTFPGYGAWQEPTIRGITTTAAGPGQDAPVAVYVDGVYQPNQAGNAFETPDLHRVEVLKGPQGTLFGRNVVGGAIMIYTRDPTFGPSGELSVSDGIYFGDGVRTANEANLKVFLSGPLYQDKLAASLSAAYRHNNGYITNELGGGRFGWSDDKYVHAKLLYQPNGEVKFVLGGFWNRRRDGVGETYLPLYGLTSANARNPATGAPVYPERTFGTEPYHVAFDFTPGIQVESYGLTLRGDIDTDAGTLTTLTGYSHVDPLVNGDIDAAYAPTCLQRFACISFNVRVPSKTFSQELDFASRKYGDLAYVVGANLYHTRSDSTQNANRGASVIRPSVVTDAFAVFGEVNYDLTDKLTGIVGLRYSWEKKTLYGAVGATTRQTFQRDGDWTSLTPRVSLRYRYNEDVNLYATYSKGFKSGVLDTNTFSNSPLRPEKLSAYEVGLKARGSRFSMDMSAYYYDYRDLQVSVLTGVISVLQNAARVRSYGFDFDGAFQATDDLRFRAGFSYLPFAKYKNYNNAIDYAPPVGPFGLTKIIFDASGKRVIRSPKLTASTTAEYNRDLAIGSLQASGTVSYSSAYSWDILATAKTKPYATLSGQISLAPAGSPLRYILFGRNLTNTAYIQGSVVGGTAAAVAYSAPREVGVTVEYRF